MKGLHYHHTGESPLKIHGFVTDSIAHYLDRAMLCYAMLCYYVMLCYVMLSYAKLSYVTLPFYLALNYDSSFCKKQATLYFFKHTINQHLIMLS